MKAIQVISPQVGELQGFSVIKTAVAKQFASMQQHRLYRTRVEKELLWETYIGSFLPGTDPVFRERSEHSCNCCRHFIRSIGNVVAIADGEIVSMWDVELPEGSIYRPVVDAMSALVKSRPIDNVFLHYEGAVGTDQNYEDEERGVITWRHFHSRIPEAHVEQKPKIPTKLGEYRAAFDVSLRGLSTITLESVDTVRELIAQNSLYRGEEHIRALLEFKAHLQLFQVLPELEHEMFVWDCIQVGALRIRNTVIGTLLVDLSEGVELDAAVRSFEQKVAPANYKRSASLVTPKMVEQAKATIQELGLETALHRRYATLDDISINNVLFADRSLRKKLGGGDVFDELMASSRKVQKPNLDRMEEIPVAKFIGEVLPQVVQIEVLLENRHKGNLVSLIAPLDPQAGKLFKWDNQFSWSYEGEMADSVKERVKNAGGNVTGDLCCRLAWYNYDDLDLHMSEPDRYEIYFATKLTQSPLGGRLDVDMNAGTGITREPVENIFYSSRETMRDGTYMLFVENFNRRENDNLGFEVEIDWLGTTYNFTYPKPMRNKERVAIAALVYDKRHDKLNVIPAILPSAQVSRKMWNLSTGQYHKVHAMMLSPNYWDHKVVGNRHWFFLLDGCKNEGSARGFFNEFLSEELTRHRKVFEIVGGKTKLVESENQLSGLGFSSTKNDYLVCRVTGSFTRELKIIF